jgi:7,8-dihydroneopterin aldolase/epimerase/oxygenase
MSDRIVLRGMTFAGHHGLTEAERAELQPFAVDVEFRMNLQPAGVEDDIARTVDYARVFEICREVVESTNFKLLEAIAEGIAHEILAAFPAPEVGVRVRKLKVPVAGTVDYAEVEIWRARGPAGRLSPERRER